MFWGVNLGLLVFVIGLIVDTAELKRIGAPVMGIVLLLSLAILAIGAWRASDEQLGRGGRGSGAGLAMPSRSLPTCLSIIAVASGRRSSELDRPRSPPRWIRSAGQMTHGIEFRRIGEAWSRCDRPDEPTGSTIASSPRSPCGSLSRSGGWKACSNQLSPRWPRGTLPAPTADIAGDIRGGASASWQAASCSRRSAAASDRRTTGHRDVRGNPADHDTGRCALASRAGVHLIDEVSARSLSTRVGLDGRAGPPEDRGAQASRGCRAHPKRSALPRGRRDRDVDDRG